jgi:MFS family permease
MSIDSARPAAALGFKQVLAVAAGNALAFYDFLTYAFFAIQIGQTFFPSKNSQTSLLISLATFGVGFVARPIGALVIGSWGDRHGRKPAMVFSFALMGLSILGLALTPSYARIGIAAPILAISFRILQGFALGGEVGPTTAYMIEAAPPLKRGYFSSFAYATQDMGVLLAGLVGTGLSSMMTTSELTDWGWRIAFILGASIVPFGLILRRRLEETLTPEQAPQKISLAPYARVIALGLALLLTGTVGNYVIDYMTTFANHTLHMNATVAFGATLVIGVFSVAADLVSGVLSDRFGRRPQMIACYVLLMLMALPAFWAIVHFHSTTALFTGSAVMSVLLSIGSGPVLTALTESIPVRVRSGVVGTVYALSITVFGGSTQLMVAWLIGLTGSALVPGFYMMAAMIVGVIAALLLRETAPRILMWRALPKT